MNLKSFSVTNHKSFRDQTKIQLSDGLNIFVGPNAGGKSNLLDVLTITMRSALLHFYNVTESRSEMGVLLRHIQEQRIFHPINRFLEKFLGDTGLSKIVAEIEVTSGDIENIILLGKHRRSFDLALQEYESKPFNDLGFMDAWHENLAAGTRLEYILLEGGLQIPRPNTRESYFLQYLQYFELFLILNKHVSEVRLRPPYLYFSPYRSSGPEDLTASLSSDNYYALLHSYYSLTSRSPGSLFKLATLYFAAKKRIYESTATAQGYEERWRNDEEVVLVNKYLNNLGYSWSLDLIDEGKNIYQIELTREGTKFNLGQASSGEKEILNFLFGIFAFNIRSGIIVIDEPELHLHPRWQGLLRELFVEMSTTTGNQFLITTHSPVFINPTTIAQVRRVYRESTGTSRVTIPSDAKLGGSRDLLHIVNSHNNEKMFFADKVVLVEGILDRLVLGAMVSTFLRLLNRQQTVEVLEVHGKHNFDKYKRFLEAFGVEHWIVADFDYIITIGDQGVKGLFVEDLSRVAKKVLADKKSKDRRSLCLALEEAIQKGLIDALSELWKYIKSRHKVLKSSLSAEEEELLRSFMQKSVADKVYILQEGEIEDYLPEGFKSIDAAIELVNDEQFLARLHGSVTNQKWAELENIVLDILEASADERLSVSRSIKDGPVDYL